MLIVLPFTVRIMDRTERTPERKPLKHGTPTGKWKERFRQGCLKRLKDKRNDMVNNLRQMDDPESPISSQELVNEVILDEWGKMKLESPLLSSGLSSLSGLTPDDDFFGMPDGGLEDIDDILNAFEDIQQELLREEEKLLSHYQDELEFDEDYLCAAIESLSTDYVLCPLCKSDNLHQNMQIVFCSCGLRIDTQDDAIDLKYVGGQLEESVDSHSASCASDPVFDVVDFSGGSINNLMMSCALCDYLSVVI